jgi:DNA polymerase III subunit epsilon
MSNNLGYAVLDFETTGFNARGRDRVVEVGIVLLSRDLEVESVFSTLVNPSRDMGAAHIHQIQTSWILDAPSFSDLVPEIHNLLRNRAIIAHNASFDVSFLVEEIQRAGHTTQISDENYACTLQLSKWALPELPNRKLATILEHLGIPNSQTHSALGDAMATASLLKKMVALRPALIVILDTLVGVTSPAPLTGSTPVTLKPRPDGQQLEENSFIARLVARLAIQSQNPITDEYFDLLSSALLDSDLSEQEISELVACADRLELGVDDVSRAHHLYFSALATQAWADGVLTPLEQTQIERIASLLGIGTLEIEQVKQGQFNRVELNTATGNPFLPGSLVALTGTMTPSKSEIASMLKAKGLAPVDSLTKKVSVLVAADTDSLSGKAATARKWGIPIVSAGAVAGLLEKI